MKEIKETFVSAIENYPIQSGLVLIGLGVILLLFRFDSQKKESYKKRSAYGKSYVINSFGLAFLLMLVGLILIFKNIL